MQHLFFLKRPLLQALLCPSEVGFDQVLPQADVTAIDDNSKDMAKFVIALTEQINQLECEDDNTVTPQDVYDTNWHNL